MSFCRFFAIFISIMKPGSMLKTYFNHTAAESICQNLFSDNHFTSQNGFLPLQGDLVDLQAQLREGESAWIKGYVEYTDFVSWEGCYQLLSQTDNRIPLKGEHYKLYHCIQDCVAQTREQYLYVGVLSHECVCLSHDDLSQHFERIGKSNCDQYQPYYTDPLPIASDSVLSVFSVINIKHYMWDQTDLQLCVKAAKKANKLFLTTVLCGSKSQNEVFCYKGDKTDSGDPFVIIVDQLSSWLQANDLCQEETGTTVAGLSVLQAYIKNLTTNTNYWTNTFRPFEVVSNSSRKVNVPTACLAVTRVEDKLVLDPDDCSQPKRVLCSDGLYNPFNTDQTTTFGQENKSETADSKQENDGASNTAIYVSVAAGFTVIVITVLCCICRRRKQHLIYKQPLDSASSGMEHILNSCENQESSDYAEANINDVNDTSTATSCKTPKKPSRRTLRKTTTMQNSAYENIKIKDMNDKGNEIRPEEEEEYDRVELKGANGSRKAQEVTYSVGGDARIYNHTLETDSQDDYDTMKSTKSARQTMDDTYNKVGCNNGNDDTNNHDTCKYDHTVSGTLKSTTTVDTNLSLDAYDN